MKLIVAGLAFAIFVVLLIVGYLSLIKDIDQPASPSITPEAAEPHPSFLYGRITVDGGATYEGRLRWGGEQEAFWGDYFNGFKDENPWARHVPADRLPKPEGIEIFGIRIAGGSEGQFLGRPFMARFGDLTRIEMVGRDVRVTLKSGTVFNLDYFSVNDMADGVRVWDASQGVIDLRPGRIRSIDFLTDRRAGAVASRLHGTVRTRQGDFTGFIQWNQNKGAGADKISGRAADGDISLRFDTIRSIARHSDKSSLVTLLDGREIALSGTQDVGDGNLGIYVDDGRYGRVLISWAAFERLDLSSGSSSPDYDAFAPGRPLSGSVTTRAGRRFVGRLVYDLDESETTETLDAPSKGVNYYIPFGMIASIAYPGPGRDERTATVTLHEGGKLELERSGDLGGGSAGMLIFSDSSPRPEYVLWTDVEQVTFDRR